MSEPLLLKRCEVIAVLMSRGLRNRQARQVLKGIPPAKHHLHSQRRWWQSDVQNFDVLAFLRSLEKDAAGQGTPNKDGQGRRISLSS